MPKLAGSDVQRRLSGRAAASDLEAIAEFIARDNETRAMSFVTELQDRVVRKLSTFPRSSQTHGRYRYMIVENYVAIYRIEERSQTVITVMVSEGHRDWRSLVSDL